MASNILDDTKKILGIDPAYTAFDLDVITHINAAFAVIDQLGVGPEGGFYITDTSQTWADIGTLAAQTNMIRTYIYLKVRILFDPPATSFMIDALTKQLSEYEWRLNVSRELEQPIPEEVAP